MEHPPTKENGTQTKNKIKKQQRDKLTITITAATAPDTIKNQLKSMHAKDMIQKCQSAITEHFKEGHIPKIHGINKLSDDEYRLHCESEEDPQLLLSKMDWSLIFNGVRIRKRKYGIVIHGVPKKDLDPTKDENEETEARNRRRKHKQKPTHRHKSTRSDALRNTSTKSQHTTQSSFSHTAWRKQTNA